MQKQTVHTDQIGRRITILNHPQRIISLVPSQTELLFDLGLDNRVVGITKFCIHPEEWFRSKTRIGGTKQVSFKTIHNLNPDLIIANKEENTQLEIEQLANDYPVWVSDVTDLNSAMAMINGVAEICGSDATNIKEQIKTGFEALKPASTLLKTLYLIWRKPFMAAGSDTFINDMIQRCGFENCTSELRYPELNLDEISNLKPDLILLSSEPYPFKESHMNELQEAVPTAKIKLVDGELFSWYGSRMMKAPSYLSDLIESINK